MRIRFSACCATRDARNGRAQKVTREREKTREAHTESREDGRHGRSNHGGGGSFAAVDITAAATAAAIVLKVKGNMQSIARHTRTHAAREHFRTFPFRRARTRVLARSVKSSLCVILVGFFTPGVDIC